MNADLIALLAGTILAVGALAFVLHPLFFDVSRRRPPARETVGAPAVPAHSGDPIEDRVRAWRASHRECRTCGLRPESDAIYCSTCGGFLDGRCPECGADVVESSAGYCSRCGTTLAATA